MLESRSELELEKQQELYKGLAVQRALAAVLSRVPAEYHKMFRVVQRVGTEPVPAEAPDFAEKLNAI